MLIALALLPACLPELPDEVKTDTAVDTATDTADSAPAGSAPVVSNVRLDPADPRTNDVLRVTFDAEDADGDTLFTAIAWTVNGALVEGQTGAELDGASWFDRDDVVDVTVSVSDGSRATEAGASVGVVNTAPTAPGVQVSGLATAELGSTTEYADLNQPYLYADVVRATRAGILTSFGVYASASACSSVDYFVLSSPTAATGTWTREWVGSGAMSSTDEYQTVGDVGVRVTPGRYYAIGWGTSCRAGVRFHYGLSGLPTNAAFGVATGYLGQAYSGSATLAGTLTYNDVYTAPEAMSVTFKPDVPAENDLLVCEVITDSEDTDADALTYAYGWEVDGLDAGVSVAEVPADRTSAGETWTCSVTASDGTATGEAGTATGTVRSLVDPEDGLVVYLPLDGSVQDDGPNAFTVSANAISYTTDRLGRTASAASLVEASWVQVASVMSIGSTTPVTMMGWVYYGVPVAAYPNAIGLHATGYSCGKVLLQIVESTETGQQSGDYGEDCVYTSSFERAAAHDEWHHWAIAHSGSQTEVFIDGVSLGVEPYAGAAVVATPLTLVLGGGSVSGNHAWFIGALDEVRVYDHALTGDEVSYIMNL